MKMCNCNKEVYGKKSEAQAAAAGILDDHKVKMTPYRCPEGNGYHLTSARTGKRLRDIPHGLGSIKHSIEQNMKKCRK